MKFGNTPMHTFTEKLNYGIEDVLAPSITSSDVSRTLVKMLFDTAVLVFLLSAMLATKAFAASGDETSERELKDGVWELLSLPINDAATSFSNLFSDDLPVDDYGKSWIIYTYNAVTRSYEQPELTESISPTQGFWIKQITGADISIDVTHPPELTNSGSEANCDDGFSCFSVPLNSSPQPGSAYWNLVGIPHYQPVSSQDIRIHVNSSDNACSTSCTVDVAMSMGYISSQLWKFDSSTGGYTDIVEDGSIKPWDGFWIATGPEAGGLDVSLLARIANSNVEITQPESVNFGKISPVDENTRIIEFTNTGPADIPGISFNVQAKSFEIRESDCGLLDDGNLVAGDSCRVVVDHTPAFDSEVEPLNVLADNTVTGSTLLTSEGFALNRPFWIKIESSWLISNSALIDSAPLVFRGHQISDEISYAEVDSLMRSTVVDNSCQSVETVRRYIRRHISTIVYDNTFEPSSLAGGSTLSAPGRVFDDQCSGTMSQFARSETAGYRWYYLPDIFPDGY